ncbi:hypothetical protein BaRGS_00016029 [Batillaria attramentaria]|uniref:Uncharacterized protein n=1 Tax=Batillaria attramentaria TaxID=370345 RepID=A0ABD0KZX6_9CAEN
MPDAFHENRRFLHSDATHVHSPFVRAMDQNRQNLHQCLLLGPHATNVEVSRHTGINNIVDEVRRRRWSWLGHALRMNKTRHLHAALRRAPPVGRKRGRPMGTTREKEEWEADGHLAENSGGRDEDSREDVPGGDLLAPYDPAGAKRIN